VLELRNISFSYGSIQVLNDISLSIRKGCTTIILGPSGCGKSTLLKLILHLIRPQLGSIEVDGAPVAEKDIRAIRQRTGYVLQDGGLFPHFTASRNVTLLANELGWTEEKQQARMEVLTALARLDKGLLSKFPRTLSGGQRQRVGLMRALMLDPDLLLLDEPLGSLDPLVRVDLQQDLKSIFGELKKTVLLVTHDLGEAAYLGDEIILMNEGRILQQGPMRTLVDHPADPFVTRFIHAQRTFLEHL